MPKRPTIRTLRRHAEQFRACRGQTQLSWLLRTEPVRLAMLAADPKYATYRIPKKRKGTFRLVEDPEPRLKRVQKRLNYYLQAVYYFHRPKNAFGFITNPVDDPDQRTIATNAARHLGCQWMLNVDMKDFFHLVNRERVYELFRAPLLKFPKNLARVLADLCTYRERLPMGAPTSPVLSNLACIPLDHDLDHFAEQRGLTYSRYADDLTFSSREQPINWELIPQINEWITAYDFQLNPAKSKLYGPADPHKEVTGLIVGVQQVSLSPDYIASLRKGIQQLDQVVNAKYVMPSGRLRATTWVDEIAQQLQGRLAFASQILPDTDPLRIELETAMDEALAPPTEYGPVSWLDFGYTLFNMPPA